MKTTKYMAALVAVLTGALSSGAKADQPLVGELTIPVPFRLAGWNEFLVTGTTNPAVDVASGFNASSSVGGVTGSGVDPGGSYTGAVGNSENVYGDNANWTGSAKIVGGPEDGYFNGAATLAQTATFTIKNTNETSTFIAYLLFDIQKAGATDPSVAVTYSWTDSLLNVLGSGPIGTVSTANTSADYADRNYDLKSLAIYLAKNDSITFTFGVASDSARLDNIAIASANPIPEPGSMLALGCFLGSGLLIRRNRRNVA